MNTKNCWQKSDFEAKWSYYNLELEWQKHNREMSMTTDGITITILENQMQVLMNKALEDKELTKYYFENTNKNYLKIKLYNYSQL